jgi:hypothetical protein
MGRAIAESTFHHFADYNWDLDRGAPSFVTEPPGRQIKDDPSRLAVFKDYVRNIATWLQPATGRHTSEDRYHQRIPPTSDLVREQEARYGATDGRGGTLEDRARGHPDDDHGAP